MDIGENKVYGDRITSNPDICHGQPVIRGTRIMVWLILEYLANGDSADDILASYPTLTREDISACLAYAAKTAKERILPMEIEANAL